MRFKITQTDEAIEEQLEKAAEGVEHGSRWIGMSYEEGVQQAINWITGNQDDAPMDED